MSMLSSRMQSVRLSHFFIPGLSLVFSASSFAGSYQNFLSAHPKIASGTGVLGNVSLGAANIDNTHVSGTLTQYHIY